MGETVRIREEAGIARILLDRPKALNALDLELAGDLLAGLVTAALSSEIRSVVISGQGTAFCAGGDLRWAAASPGGAGAGFHQLAALLHRSITEIRRMDKPVIAAINGVAAGAGFSLALACDFRVMARGAVLRQAYSSAGLCIDGGGTFTLPRLVGLARALEIASFDPVIDADQALAWGMVTRVVEDGRAEAEALEMARRLGATSLSSFAWSKRLLGSSFDTPLEVQLERERAALVACADLPDGREGVRAFIEKRKPVFGRESPAS